MAGSQWLLAMTSLAPLLNAVFELVFNPNISTNGSTSCSSSVLDSVHLISASQMSMYSLTIKAVSNRIQPSIHAIGLKMQRFPFLLPCKVCYCVSPVGTKCH